jgi:hypothetical protein
MGPDGDAGGGQLYLTMMEGSTGTKQILVYRRPLAGGSWTLAPEAPPLSSFIQLAMPARGRLTALFLPLLDGFGEPMPGGEEQLAVFWTEYNSTDFLQRDWWHARRAYQSGRVSSSTPFFFVDPPGAPAPRWSIRMPRGIDRPMPAHSVAVTRRYREASALYNGTDWYNSAQVLRNALYVPDATGHVDFDDAARMSQKMCSSLWHLPKGANAACFCQTMANCSSSSLYYLPSTMTEPCSQLAQP